MLSALLRMSEQAPFYLYTAFGLSYIKDLHKSTYVVPVTVGGALEPVAPPQRPAGPQAGLRHRRHLMAARRVAHAPVMPQ